jgi:hypothetical protein
MGKPIINEILFHSQSAPYSRVAAHRELALDAAWGWDDIAASDRVSQKVLAAAALGCNNTARISFGQIYIMQNNVANSFSFQRVTAVGCC